MRLKIALLKAAQLADLLYRKMAQAAGMKPSERT